MSVPLYRRALMRSCVALGVGCVVLTGCSPVGNVAQSPSETPASHVMVEPVQSPGVESALITEDGVGNVAQSIADDLAVRLPDLTVTVTEPGNVAQSIGPAHTLTEALTQCRTHYVGPMLTDCETAARNTQW